MTISVRRLALASLGAAAFACLAMSQAGWAQPTPGNGPPANGPPRLPAITADTRVQQKTYNFAPTDE